MIDFDLKKVAQFVTSAPTDDLLDRVTVYREGMEPAALELMEDELDRRGLTVEEIVAHAELYRSIAVRKADGSVRRCDFCDRPAVIRHWGLRALWGKIPLVPWKLSYCEGHLQEMRGRSQ